LQVRIFRNLILTSLGVLALAGCPETQVAAPLDARPKVARAPKPAPKLTTTTFRVEGMTCTDCSRAIEGKLIGLPGVSTVSADDKAGRAVVQYDAAKVNPDDIIAAIDALKFKASLAQ
jgi:copper chaperone CopZ